MPSYQSICEEVVRNMGVNNITSRRASSSPNMELLVFECMNSGYDTHFTIAIDEPAEHLSITSQPRWKMPRDKLVSTLLYVTLLNYKLALGTVDLDMDDGEVRYKTTGTFGAAGNIKPIVKNFMNLHVRFGKRYLEGFTAIKDRNASAEDAVRIAEQSVSADRTPEVDEVIRMWLRSMRAS